MNYENFYALDEEKQDRIRDAAMRAFGRHGYKKTSTEQIAVSAGIAKGMVFHYFGTKKGLYEYLVSYATDFIGRYMEDFGQRVRGLDYIESFREATKIKLSAYLKNPTVFEFATSLYLDGENLYASEKVRKMFTDVMELREEKIRLLGEVADAHRFRKDMDADRMKNYILWLINGYADEIVAGMKGHPLADIDLDPYWTEFDKILDDVKKLFYVQE